MPLHEISAKANGLHSAYALLRDLKASGTDGGTFTLGAWRTRDLNTEVDPSGIVTLSSNQFTLGAGTYFVAARAPCYTGTNANGHQTRLRDTTNSTTLGLGSTVRSGGETTTTSDLACRFTLSASAVLELQHQTSVTQVTFGFGASAGFGDGEVYAEVEIWREG